MAQLSESLLLNLMSPGLQSILDTFWKYRWW